MEYSIQLIGQYKYYENGGAGRLLLENTTTSSNSNSNTIHIDEQYKYKLEESIASLIALKDSSLVILLANLLKQMDITHSKVWDSILFHPPGEQDAFQFYRKGERNMIQGYVFLLYCDFIKQSLLPLSTLRWSDYTWDKQLHPSACSKQNILKLLINHLSHPTIEYLFSALTFHEKRILLNYLIYLFQIKHVKNGEESLGNKKKIIHKKYIIPLYYLIHNKEGESSSARGSEEEKEMNMAGMYYLAVISNYSIPYSLRKVIATTIKEIIGYFIDYFSNEATREEEMNRRVSIAVGILKNSTLFRSGSDTDHLLNYFYNDFLQKHNTADATWLNESTKRNKELLESISPLQTDKQSTATPEEGATISEKGARVYEKEAMMEWIKKRVLEGKSTNIQIIYDEDFHLFVELLKKGDVPLKSIRKYLLAIDASIESTNEQEIIENEIVALFQRRIKQDRANAEEICAAPRKNKERDELLVELYTIGAQKGKIFHRMVHMEQEREMVGYFSRLIGYYLQCEDEWTMKKGMEAVLGILIIYLNDKVLIDEHLMIISLYLWLLFQFVQSFSMDNVIFSFSDRRKFVNHFEAVYCNPALPSYHDRNPFIILTTILPDLLTPNLSLSTDILCMFFFLFPPPFSLLFSFLPLPSPSPSPSPSLS